MNFWEYLTMSPLPSDGISVLSQDIIERLSAKSLRLPASPEVVLKINALMNDDTKGLVDISAAIESHQTLAARLLQVVNSPALKPIKPITSLYTALSILGIVLVKNLAISIAIRDMFRSKNFDLKVLLEETWHHSVEVGALSHLLTAHLEDRRYDPNVAMIIGILHSIGCLPIIDYFEQTSTPIVEYAKVSEEIASLISVSLMKEWGLPSSFAEAINGDPGMYGEILKYIHCYLDKTECANILVPFDEFDKIVKSNKDRFSNLVSIYK
jgi:HD-like signal output (HDOD) protein